MEHLHSEVTTLFLQVKGDFTACLVVNRVELLIIAASAKPAPTFTETRLTVFTSAFIISELI